MLKIGTHDSITGEKSMVISWPLIPFARTQNKSILAQFRAGCRLFDIRVKYISGKWRGAHGWWFTRKSLEQILIPLFELAKKEEQVVHILLTYEGRYENTSTFMNYINKFIEDHKGINVKFGPVCSKYAKSSKGIKVEYETLKNGQPNWIDTTTEQHFLSLDGRSWHTYFPIPWLWKKLYFNKVEFDNKVYKFVDFL